MDKIKIDAGGYELNGKYITPADIDKLSAEEIEALANTTASAWEILKIRAGTHNLINAINAILGSCQMNCLTASETN